MALDPYRRILQRSNRSETIPPKASRVPHVIGVIGLVALLGIVYQLSVAGLFSKTTQLFSWSIQAPP